MISIAVAQAAPSYNEAEIRFYIIDPVIRRLGYDNSENVYLRLEEKLEYPFYHIGRRSKRDLPLGFPDYRAGVKGARGSFIVEAKAGKIPITSIEVEQAHSYAAHSQVGANYFVLCNGISFCIFATLSGAHADPLVEIPLDQIEDRFFEIENILSPAKISKNCRVVYDRKLKIADGLGSSVRIRSGKYFLEDYSYRLIVNEQDCTALARQFAPHQLATMDHQLELMKTSFALQVSDGIAERSDDGQITAHVKFTGATVHNHEAMKLLGITEMMFATADKFISLNPELPTVFESTKQYSVSSGTTFPQMFGGASIVDANVKGDMFVKAAMHYAAGKICGPYVAFSNQVMQSPENIPMQVEMEFSGKFELIMDIE